MSINGYIVLGLLAAVIVFILVDAILPSNRLIVVQWRNNLTIKNSDGAIYFRNLTTNIDSRPVFFKILQPDRDKVRRPSQAVLRDIVDQVRKQLQWPPEELTAVTVDLRLGDDGHDWLQSFDLKEPYSYAVSA